ncbi:MAG: hypothetical protein K2Q10_04820 [Rhodospirillales bacterium]|nr:hypothetical protein [Rhodospirillales bacterium]
MAELEAKLNEPPKTLDNSSLPLSKGQKGNCPAKTKRDGPRQGSLGRKGGGRALATEPDQIVAAKVCSDETSLRIDGKTCWNWVFQNGQVVSTSSARAGPPPSPR